MPKAHFSGQVPLDIQVDILDTALVGAKTVDGTVRFAVIMEAIETLMIHNGIESPGIGAMARTALAKVRAGDS